MSALDDRLAAMSNAELDLECLRAWREAIGCSDRRRTDACWFACRDRNRTASWERARDQAVAERRQRREL